MLAEIKKKLQYTYIVRGVSGMWLWLLENEGFEKSFCAYWNQLNLFFNLSPNSTTPQQFRWSMYLFKVTTLLDRVPRCSTRSQCQGRCQKLTIGMSN